MNVLALSTLGRLTACALIAGAAALAQAQTPPTPPITPVTLPDGRIVQVSAPPAQAHPDGGWMDWRFHFKRTSLDRRFTALGFVQSSNNPKHDPVEVHLVKPSGQIIPLKNSDVFDVLWTIDGQYLIGQGSNTLRLWNTNGGLRVRQLPRMDRLDVIPNLVCVAVRDFTDSAGNATDAWTVYRLHIPSLRPAGQFKLPEEPTERQRFCR